MTFPTGSNRPESTQTLLEADGVSAVIDRVGARLASLRVDGRELLVGEGDEPLLWGCYPMVPWVGRINHGRFEFGGRSYQMPINMAPHAIHGLGLDREWSLDADGVLRLDLSDPWPFGGTAKVTSDLQPDRLTITLSVTAGDVAMPAVIGWHPVLRKTIGSATAELEFDPSRIWIRSASGIPTGDMGTVPAGPWDDCFDGVSAAPVITWSDGFTLTFDSPTDTWVVYDETAHALCVEPQTGSPDAFNRDDCRVLLPTETAEIPLTFRWHRPLGR